MELMSLKQYAESRKITYEAARKSVNKYRDQLVGHIIRDNGTQFLDEEAIAFLTDKRRQYKMVVVTEDYEARVKELEKELDTITKMLLSSQENLTQVQNQLLEAKDTIIEATKNNSKYTALLEDHERTVHALEQAEDELTHSKEELSRSQEDLKQTQADLEEVRTKANKTERERDEAVTESLRYQKTWFGLYKKV